MMAFFFGEGKYIKKIMERYEHYKQFIRLE